MLRGQIERNIERCDNHPTSGQHQTLLSLTAPHSPVQRYDVCVCALNSEEVTWPVGSTVEEGKESVIVTDAGGQDVDEWGDCARECERETCDSE